ncbi:RNA methyltransferase [Heliorestis acidaminivorans]|uniref:RNA methyltransferase n=1 Tax=Heliorestis acidaminivorans TaxID=553427 RepID=A0A6I0EY84_9FIRM|nr:RNA methyltransferase [Heliorestis acidaminivorans]KAB2951569.1 RNA methyltransferase [Heliorestis acidaminivorans]
MPTITSDQNKRVKEARTLSRKKGRGIAGRYLIEGRRLVEEAVASKIKIDYFLFTDRMTQQAEGQKLISALQAQGSEGLLVQDKTLQSISETEHSQGIVAIAPLPEVLPLEKLSSIKELQKGDYPFFLILNGLQDPGNVGTILRSAEATAVDAVILTTGTADPFNPKVIRASMGSLFRMPLVQASDEEALWHKLKENNCTIIVADLGAEKAYYDLPWDKKQGLALVIGSEGQGPSPFFQEKADHIATIPLSAPVESLNASIAAAILLFEVVKGR